MGFVSDSVIAEYQKIDLEAPIAPISRASVDEAIKILRKLKIYRTRDVFLYLSAINLLNAAVKQAEYKNELSYGFIKGYVVLATRIIIARFQNDTIRYYYSTDEKCLYFEVFGVVFSFHNIYEDPQIIKTLTKAEKIVWPGIRLQRIATPLFELAKIVYHQS